MTGPAAAAPETVVARLRPHSRELFWPHVLLILLAAALGYFSGLLREPWQAATLLAATAVVAVAGRLVPLLRWASAHYTVTTRRVVVRRGILVRSRQEVLLSRIGDITVRRRGLQSAFRSADVLINAAGDRSVVLRDVPAGDLVKEALHDLVELSGSRQSGD